LARGYLLGKYRNGFRPPTSLTLDDILSEIRGPSYSWLPTHVSGDPEMVGAFIDAVRNDTPPLVTGEDGLRAVEVALGAYESARTGAPVRLASSGTALTG
jgi:predicted dehydrogenase